LKLIFLIVSRAVSVLGLSRREAWWKDAEIRAPRTQLVLPDTQDERGGVVAGERVHDVNGPARRGRAGPGVQGVAGVLSLSR
jgi:hypothetical protein